MAPKLIWDEAATARAAKLKSEGRSYSEVAAIMGMPRGSIGGVLCRAGYAPGKRGPRKTAAEPEVFEYGESEEDKRARAIRQCEAHERDLLSVYPPKFCERKMKPSKTEPKFIPHGTPMRSFIGSSIALCSE